MATDQEQKVNGALAFCIYKSAPQLFVNKQGNRCSGGSPRRVFLMLWRTGKISLAPVADEPADLLRENHDCVTDGCQYLDREIARWQEAIYKLCCKECPDKNIDGSGCDSGDALDLTLAEIGQAIGHWIDRASGFDPEWNAKKKTQSTSPLAHVGLACGRLVLFIADIPVAMEGDTCRAILPEEVTETIAPEELARATIGGKSCKDLPIRLVRFFRGDNWHSKSLEWAADEINQTVSRKGGKQWKTS